jgi:hypothetical protein
MVADLMPAPSPSDSSRKSTLFVLLGPARVHAKQDAGPILALGAAGAGMDFEIGLVGVGFTRQQRFEFAPRGLGLERLEHRLGLGDDALILLGIAELDHGDLVCEIALDPADGVELIVERVALLHHALGAGDVIPQRRIFGLRAELGRRALAVEVKDASSAVNRPLDVFNQLFGFGAHA